MKAAIAAKISVIILVFQSSSYALACSIPDDADVTIEEDGLTVGISWQQDTPPIVGEIFELNIIACQESEPFVGQIKASAVMPAHNHGMNYQPNITMKSPGQYIGTGFVFHMLGTWRLKLNFFSDERRYNIEHDLTL
jgi:hypothetical protein